MKANPEAIRAVAQARAKIGCPYVWGADGPSSFDCSGLVDWSYRRAGYNWPTRLDSAHQIKRGTPVHSEAELLPGDLVRPFVGHIVIYAGNGRIIEAAGAPPGNPNLIPVREFHLYGFHDATRLVPAIPDVVHQTGTLRVGSSGPAVQDLQHTLNTSYPLYSRLAVDGKFGPKTEAVVREFQKRAGLTVDGIVGPHTKQRLGI